jgi:23S rRNA maturation mini-RNase III
MMMRCFDCEMEILPTDQYLTVWEEGLHRFHLCCVFDTLQHEIIERMNEKYAEEQKEKQKRGTNVKTQKEKQEEA